MILQDNIKFLLHKNGMKLEEHVQKLGVSKTAFYSYIKGNPSLSTIEKLAEALNTSPENIITQRLLYKDLSSPIKQQPTTGTIVCPHCGQPITIHAE